MTLTHGGLFEGYGGTTLAAEKIFGPMDRVWYSDIKPASVALLAHRHPGVPNLGDMTTVDWAATEPVDVLTVSWPCQPHSSAGLRLGAEDPRALWPHVAHAIDTLRPAYFLGENVARIARNGELRRVACSLAELGYVGAWRCVTAASVGAPHKRDRCFVVAVRADVAADPGGGGLPEHPQCHGEPVSGEDGECGGDPVRCGPRGEDRLTLLPTPTQNMTTGPGTSGRDGGMNLQTAAVSLLPTPNTGMGKAGFDPIMGQARLDSGRRNLQDAVAAHLLPTPTTRDGRRGKGWGDQPGRPLSETVHRCPPWGDYEDAIRRWETITGRRPPSPVQPSPRAPYGPQLSPRFVEWMMGLESGHVTAPMLNLTRNQQLSLLGDGVVPQQGAAAFAACLAQLAETRRLTDA